MTVPPLPRDAAGPLPVAAGYGLSPGSHGQAREPLRWLLQADAARAAGCSVSAIRKWRREGSVASRKITTPAGLERVEVRLDDVLRRAGPRAVMPPPGAAGEPGPTVANTVLVPVDDFQALLERVAVAERLAGGLEARLRAIDAEADRMREQFVALRRQIEQERARESRSGATPAPGAEVKLPSSRQVARAPVPVPKPAPGQPPGMFRGGHGAVSAPGAPVPEPAPAGDPLLPELPPEVPPASPVEPAPPKESATFRQWLGTRRPPEKPRVPAYDVERLATELRRLYGRLQGRQGQAEVSPAEAERWVADLAAYDAALVRGCRALGVPVPSRMGERIPASDRVALTRTLAAAGLDVRRTPQAAPDLT